MFISRDLADGAKRNPSNVVGRRPRKFPRRRARDRLSSCDHRTERKLPTARQVGYCETIRSQWRRESGATTSGADKTPAGIRPERPRPPRNNSHMEFYARPMGRGFRARATSGARHRLERIRHRCQGKGSPGSPGPARRPEAFFSLHTPRYLITFYCVANTLSQPLSIVQDRAL